MTVDLPLETELVDRMSEQIQLEVADRVASVLRNYIGQLADQATIARIYNHIQSEISYSMGNERTLEDEFFEDEVINYMEEEFFGDPLNDHNPTECNPRMDDPGPSENN